MKLVRSKLLFDLPIVLPKKITEKLPPDTYSNEFRKVLKTGEFTAIEIVIRRERETGEPFFRMRSLYRKTNKGTIWLHDKKTQEVKIPTSLIEDFIGVIDLADAVCIEKEL